MPESFHADGGPSPSDNPYQSPTAYGTRSEVMPATLSPNDPEHLRRVAIYQKGVIFAICVYLLNLFMNVVSGIAQVNPPVALTLSIAVLALVAVLVGIVSVGLLAGRMHGAVIGVAMAFVAFIPCVNLIMLFVINHQATQLLKRNGVHVGFLGARMSNIRDLATAKSPFASTP
jgi:hypothetical protein